MKTDLYTKTVLSIIAICLTIIACSTLEILPSVQANQTNNTALAGYGLVPLNADGSIDVKISSASTLTVNIQEIGGMPCSKSLPVKFDDLIDVNIEEVNGSSLYSGIPIYSKDEIKVNLTELSGSSIYGGLPVNVQ
jgi:hypothetical protein